MQQNIQPLTSSYRDPSGFMFEKDGTLYRQVNKVFKNDFDHFTSSGCYEHLVKNKWLVAHQEVRENFQPSEQAYKILQPEKIPFISYAYEWCFDMLKDAALLTLHLMKESLPYKIILKDASPYNVQWLNGSLIFIDTLSFEKYDSSKPWVAYRQFCENFLSPLLLMHHSKQPLQSLLLSWPDGIPLAVTSSLLPWKSRLSFYTYLHIHLQQRLTSKNLVPSEKEILFSEKKLHRLIDSLQSLVRSLSWKGNSAAWDNYYHESSKEYLQQKKNIVEKWLHELPESKTALDAGANRGEFSAILSQKNIFTISIDADHSCINKLYQGTKSNKEKNILPMILDISNPSPSIGVNNKERASFFERTQVDITLALALVHHLAIGKNIPFEKIADFFKQVTNYLIVEFIPKQDEKIQFMLHQKKTARAGTEGDGYDNYNEENFVQAFRTSFSILKKEPAGSSGRNIYLMKKNA